MNVGSVFVRASGQSAPFRSQIVARPCYLRGGLRSEPVSPELVLVDPELARRERARLEERLYLEETLNIAAIRRALESEPVPVEDAEPRTSSLREIATFSQRQLVLAALMVSLLANGLFVAHIVGGNTRTGASPKLAPLALSLGVSTAPTTVAASPPARSSTRVVGPRSASSEPGPPSSKPPLVASKAVVERRVISLILASSARKLPRRFVDPTTGLVKNNVQVVCRRSKMRSFLCVVRLPSHAQKEGLYVRYRPGRGGHGVFTWYGYRQR